MNLIGIEMSHGFGDAMFSIPLIEALCARDGCKAVIASKQRCADAYYGVPCIQSIEHTPDMYHGERILRSKYPIKAFYQITPQAYFMDFKASYPDHSLVATAMAIGRKYGVEIDPQPKVYLSPIETQAAEQYFKKFKGEKIIAIESEHFSGQSWSCGADLERVIIKHPQHFFLWLSLREPPFTHPNLHHIKHDLDRRSCIGLLKHVDLFINVGSGFFCASLSKTIQPKESWMLWRDDVYKYKHSITMAGWIPNAHWFDDRTQWSQFIEKTII